MQDSSLYSQIKPQLQSRFPEQEQVKCPRCDSTNTKFCYYNNYNLSQPRHFCKSCRRYWTKGGALRNVPVGGGSRKNSKRSSSSSSSSSTSASAKRPASVSASDNKNDAKFNNSSDTAERLSPTGENFGVLYGSLLEGGCFTSLLDSTGPNFGPQFGNLLDGLGPNGAGLPMSDHFDPGSGQIYVGPDMELDSGDSSNAAAADEFLNIQGGGDGGDPGDCGGGGPGVSI